ncbi:MAG: bifunctional folylpolyglutamate synthase/dihydrofolate synthase [Gaiellaceae bacterium]
MSAKLSAAEALALVTARERFGVRLGLERMRMLLEQLGHPQRRYPAIHVVGTNGKSTTARKTEELLAAAGLATGTYLSPHVSSLAERFRVRGRELDVSEVIEPVLGAVAAVDRDASESVTQFELLTAAALNAFASHEVDVAIVEAGLGGRYDATNVLNASVVILTNIALEHQQQLGTTREAIAAEKLAVVGPGATVVLGEREWEQQAGTVANVTIVHAAGADALAQAAAEAHLGTAVRVEPALSAALPGRVEVVADQPRELWDGAHNPHAVAWLSQRLGETSHVLVLSVLVDKEVDEMLRAFAGIGRVLVATESSNPRALSSAQLATQARSLGCFDQVETVSEPVAARARGVELARSAELPLLISGSLYLLQDLTVVRPRRVA